MLNPDKYRKMISFGLGIFIFLNTCSLSFCAVNEELTEEEKANEPQGSMLTDMQSENPIIVNGDKIDYAQDKNIVTIDGNVEITKGNSVMTCDRATVNTLTNDAHAEGNVILKDLKGIIKARSCDYNFKTQTGLAFDANVAYKPYYGKGKIVKKVSENEIEIKNGYFTTCDKDHPHYRIQSRLLEIFPEDKVTCRAMTFRVANTPIIYMPKFTQNLKDDRMHVQVTPGKSKDWGMFLLTAWRYDLLNNSGGRVHLDYREKKELAWGIDNYYDTKTIGKGYFKTYYMNERYLGRKRLYKYPRVLKATTDTQRYRIQWRHKWEVDKKSYWQLEYNKVTDTNFIKDYFFREYEKNNENVSTSSYLQYNRTVADTDTLSFLARKRTSRIFSETEVLPEIKYDHPSAQILESPFYISNAVTYDSFNKVTGTTPGNAGSWGEDEASQRIDNYSRLSLPFKLSFLELNPFMGTRETYFQRIAGRNAGQFREVWDSGVDATSRFYRIFDVQSDKFGIEINKLRHIISPTVGWAYTYKPTVSSSKLLQFDGLDSIGEANQINMSLENKLQTKRGVNKTKDGVKEQVLQTVDFVRFITSTDYKFAIEGRKRQWNHNVTFDLETIPYNWLRFESDANLDRKKGYFTNANFDLKASGKGISWGGGYRYERKSSSQMTGEIILDLIKGWSFTVYQRLQFKGNSLVKEQTYKLSKELHCWILDINYNVLREKGETIWFALRLKAFPEMALDYNNNYNEPKANSQGYAEGKSSD